MNSKKIQEKHPQVYETLYATSDIVCSAPIGLNWGVEYVTSYGGMGLMQKLPLRVYVGLTKKRDKQICDFLKCQVYLPETNEFIDYHFESKMADNILKTLKFLNFDYNYSFQIVSEYSFDRGLLTSGALITSLVGAIMLANNKITAEQLEQFTKLIENNFEKSNITDKYLIDFLNLVYLFNSAIMFSSNAGNLLSFFNGAEIFLYHGKPIDRLLDRVTRYDAQKFQPIIDQSDYSFVNLNRTFKLEENALPLDYWLVFGGREKTSTDELHMLLPANLEANRFLKFFDEHKKALSMDKQDRIFNEKLDLSDDKIVGLYQRLATILSVKLLKNIHSIFVDYNQNLVSFFKDFNSIGKLLELFDLIDASVVSMWNRISHWGQKHFDGKFSCRVLYKSDFLFLAEKNTLKVLENNFINDLSKGHEISPFIYYRSWEDGLEERGLIIEQYLVKNIKSGYFKSQPARGFECINGKINNKDFLLDDLESIKNKSDIFIDCNDMKMYFKGHLLNSKELRSAVKTIILLRALLKSNGQVRPSELNLNSYAERNEMQSKIVTPIEKMAKKYLKRKLYLELSGGIASNYTIKFDPGSLVINVLEEIA